MNTALTTGYLMKPAEQACTAGGRYKLLFEAMLQAQGDADATPWHCEIDSPELMQRAGPKLVAGAAVVIRAQLAGRPYQKHGVHSGWVRYLKVEAVEFIRADRNRAEAEPEEQPHA